MSNVYTRFPNIEDVLRALFVDKLGLTEDQVGSIFPENDEGPFIRIEKIGGIRTRLNDYPSVDIDVVASTYGQTESLAESVSMLILGFPHRVTLGELACVLDAADETRSFTEVPYPDSSYRRLSATYDLSLRA